VTLVHSGSLYRVDVIRYAFLLVTWR